MTARTRADMKAQATALIDTAGTQGTTGAEIESLLHDEADSALYPEDDLDAAKLASGLVATARLGSGTADANTFLRGDQTWAAPAGSGDMLAATYDPMSVQSDAFARANHHGEQAIGTVTGLQTALDGKAAATHSHDATAISSGTINIDRIGTGTRDGTKVLQDDGQWVAQTGGSGATNLTFTRDATTVTVLSDTGTDAVLPAASTSNAGVLSAADKTKLDGITPGSFDAADFIAAGETVFGWPDWTVRMAHTPSILIDEAAGAIEIYSNFPGTLHRLSDTNEYATGTAVAAEPDPITITVVESDYSGLIVLDPGEGYEHFLFVTDVTLGSNPANVVNIAVAVKPTLSNGAAINVTTSAADITFETNYLGYDYMWGRYAAGSEPTPAEIEAGGGTGYQAGPTSVAPTDGTETIALSGLSDATSYRIAITQRTSANAGAAYADPIYVDFMTGSSSTQATWSEFTAQRVVTAATPAANTVSQTYDVSALADGTEIPFIAWASDPGTAMSITGATVAVDGGGEVAPTRTLLAPVGLSDATANNVLAVGAWLWVKTAGANSVVFKASFSENTSRRGITAGTLSDADAAGGTINTASGTALTNTTVSPSSSINTDLNGLVFAIGATHGSGGASNSWSGGVSIANGGFDAQAGSTPTRFTLAVGNGTGSSMTPALNSTSSQSMLVAAVFSVPPA